MKARIEFDIPEDLEEFKKASNIGGYSTLLFDFDQYLRGKIKYEDREDFQEIRDYFYELADENGVTIY